MEAEVPLPRWRAMGPVWLLGALGAGSLAFAAARPWLSVDEATAPTTPGWDRVVAAELGGSPAATALSLVILAGWGALIVTRGRLRRALALMGLVAAVVAALVTFPAPGRLRVGATEALTEAGYPATVQFSTTGWYLLAVVGALGAVTATGLAVRWVGAWPEMGERYDRETGGRATDAADPGPDWWRAMDEGRDPTQ